MQQATQTQVPDAAALSRQIREQVRQQVRAAQEQAQVAREQARHAQQAGQQAQAAPPAPPPLPGVSDAPLVAGTTVPPFTVDPFIVNGRLEDIAIAFFVMVASLFFIVPIARALARRIVSRPTPAPLDQGLADQLKRIENSVDSMAIEIERISEAQRYMVRLQSDRGGSPALPPQQAAS